GDYPPFSDWPEGAAAPQGFEPELLRTWASATGRRIEWVRFDWPDLVGDARAGVFDLAAGGITVRSDRSIVGTFGVPLAESGAVVLVADGSELGLGSLDSAAIRIAVNRGGHLEQVARSRFPLAETFPTSPNAAVPGRLARGEVDAVVTDTRESPLWRASHPDWRELGPLTRDRKAVFAAPGREHLVAELDAWLLQRPGSDALDALRTKHLGDDPSAHHLTVTDALLAAVDERLALMPDVARFKRANDAPIEVPEREARVLDAAWLAVRAAASDGGRSGPSSEAVRAFYRAQMEAAKAIQRRIVATEHAAAGDDPIPDLDTQLRPALIRIGDRIARLVVMLPDAAPPGLERDTADALMAHGLDDASVTAIADALVALIESARGED
ncbi:MAG: transporter substrate-binding domain-containing protein, partial [Actinomycetota bacterium]|nr:transporter substrate-binding domain-containing protein [Actinomycetota bacterium]